MLSAVMEDYIKAIYSIQEEADERVGTSELADYLDVTSPTVSSMLNTLEERGLVDREEYRGVTLTEEGETVEVRRIRHQGDEELRYLAQAGIEPGVEIEVVERAPVGLVTVRTPAGEQGLPEELAALIETTEATEAEA